MDTHCAPTGRAHVTTGYDCWCRPEFLLPCDECETGCWRCVDGTVPLTRAEADASAHPVIVVHHR